MNAKPRAAFTLVELLVVTVILIGLWGLVLGGVRQSRSDGDVRRGAQQLVSIMLASQSMSLGSPTGAAVIIDSEGAFGTVVTQARRYPFIEGVVVAGVPFSPAAEKQTVRLSPVNDSIASLAHGYRIRFLERSNGTDGPTSDWFSLKCLSTTSGSAEIRVRMENNQSTRTTVWPTAAASGSLSFQAARYPIPNGLTQSLPKGVVIDLSRSGYGDEALADWKSLHNRGDIAVGFDTVGSVDALMQNVLPVDGQSRTVQPITPNELVYFFVTLQSDLVNAAQGVSPLASEKALWVVVHPRTGRVTIAPNVPQQRDDADALRAAREKARQGIQG